MDGSGWTFCLPELIVQSHASERVRSKSWGEPVNRASRTIRASGAIPLTAGNVITRKVDLSLVIGTGWSKEDLATDGTRIKHR
jgi:hypothetical protein